MREKNRDSSPQMKKKQNNFFLAHARERDKVRVKRKEYSEGGAGE